MRLSTTTLFHTVNTFKNIYSKVGNSPIFICIGTDRLIGDSLGPVVGSMLVKESAGAFPVYGTLENPVHALNVEEISAQIKKKHPDSFIIAVDASLGSEHQIGSVFLRAGSVHPGAGVNKKLQGVGDIAVTGITSMESSHPYLSLQTARLSTVMAMAEYICRRMISCFLPDGYDLYTIDASFPSYAASVYPDIPASASDIIVPHGLPAPAEV